MNAQQYFDRAMERLLASDYEGCMCYLNDAVSAAPDDDHWQARRAHFYYLLKPVLRNVPPPDISYRHETRGTFPLPLPSGRLDELDWLLYSRHGAGPAVVRAHLHCLSEASPQHARWDSVKWFGWVDDTVTRSLAAAPDDADVAMVEAEYRASQRRYPAAKEAVERALRLLHREGGRPERIVALTQECESERLSSDAYLERAILHAAAGHMGQAQRDCRAARRVTTDMRRKRFCDLLLRQCFQGKAPRIKPQDAE